MIVRLRWRNGLIGSALLCAAATIAPTTIAAANEPLFEVGVAEVDITPAYPIRLNGFGFRREESEGVTQHIWAKAIAIGSDAEQRLILITVDTTGLRESMVDEVAARLKAKAGIARERLAVTFSHSHTTPKLTGTCDTIFSSPIPPEHQERIDRYTRELTDALEQVALAALADRQPATLSWAIGKVGFAQNRRTPGGPVDHDLPVLVVKSPADNSIRAVYVTYACHCVTLRNNKISGDWAGFAQEAIERKHPGAIALVSIGCGSDSNPSSRDNVAIAIEQGAEIANEVERLLQGNLKPISGDVTAELQHLSLPLEELPTREELEKLATNDDPAGYNAKYQLAKLDRGEPLQSAIDYPIQTWSFGDRLAMVFLAGEVCVDYSLQLKQDFDPKRVWIHGYSNDFGCYIPSERLLREGGYGGGAEVVYFALPATLRSGLEKKIIDEVHRQVPRQFHQNIDSQKASAFQPTPPAEALAAIRTSDDFVVELMAAEPLVADPVAIDFGPDGRLWVAEMRDYSRGVDEKFDQSGCVRVLVDKNGDGRFDDATVFAHGLRFPTDVKVWRKGAIVCDAPDVIYLEDTDDDGHADLHQILLTGFATHNAQARVNSLRWGLDNWLYGSCGLFGGNIRSVSGVELKLGSRDFRFKPDNGQIEPVTGKTQQGRARNDWGDWFACENGTLCKHYPLSEQYLARNPHLMPPPADVFVPTGGDPNRLFPTGSQVLFKLSGPPGRPTAVCGLEIYRDELLGPTFRGNTFVAEPVNQLVHRLTLEPRGASFAGRRAEDELKREFAASTDNWFRPVQIRTGIDGCLWIVDMCRYVIEHPRFIPEETLRKLDPMAGNHAGRIYRVRPRNTAPRPPLRLDQLEVDGLVAALDSPNGPQRDWAQQLLVERGDLAAVPPLAELFAKAERAETRLHALCTLDGLESLTEELVLRALQDPHAGVRRHAIRLSEPFPAHSANIGKALLSLVDEDDAQVQMQLAYTLGEWKDPRACEALSALAWKYHAEPYILTALLSSVSAANASDFVNKILSRRDGNELPASLRDALITIATKLGDDSCRRDLLIALNQHGDGEIPFAQMEALAKYLESLDAAQRRHLFAADKPTIATLEQITALARRVIANPNGASQETLVAIRILAITNPADKQLADDIRPLLGPQAPPEVQQAAVEFLARAKASLASDLLLSNWTSYTPAVRSQVIDVFFARDEMLLRLLGSIERGDVNQAQFDALQRQRLLTHANPAVRAAAASALASAIDSNRKKVIESYAEATRKPGNAAHGREVFRKNCSSCHRLEGQGHSVGPDLAALTSRTTASLLEAIFDPNRALDERYENYFAITADGQTLTGILAGETSNSITLVEQQGKEHTLLRNELEEFKSSGVSLMPEGFEKDLSPSDVADLFAYLSTQGTPPKQLAGNEPAVVKPDADGALWLLASNCEVYGDEIVFESPFSNIGYWHSPTDHVAWTIEVDREQKYDVFLHWACAPDSTGNTMVVEGFEFPVQSTVDGTGGWNLYKTRKIGNVSVLSGTHRIVIRPLGPSVNRNVMDLRGLYLVPANAAATPSADENNSHFAPHPPGTSTAIKNLLVGLPVGTPGEYERIPAIWQEAIAAGKRNEPIELLRLLELSLPQLDEPLQHWQAVVIGGGIVNGLSQAGVWPRQRILQLLRNNQSLISRWTRTIALAAVMVDDSAVREGTRYDALRILGADEFESRGAHLIKYLNESHELQMGAVSGLSDMEAPAVADALVSTYHELHEGNDKLAIDALLRTDARASALQDAIDAGNIPHDALTVEQSGRLEAMTRKSAGQPNP